MEPKESKFDREVLVQRVQLCLTTTGETIATFARSIGRTPSGVYRIFSGERDSEQVWTELAKHLGYDPRVKLKGPGKEFVEAIAMVSK